MVIFCFNTAKIPEILMLIFNFKQTAAVFRICLTLFCLLTVSSKIYAQGISITPVSISLASGQMTSMVTLTNSGDADLSFQVRSFKWDSSPEAPYHLTPTDQLLVSPPLGTIPPHNSQIIRIVLRRAATTTENSYRILIDQIPAPGTAGIVNVAIRLSIPLFAAPPSPVSPHLQWSIERSTAGTFLIAFNTGGKHLKIYDVSLSNGKKNIKIKVEISPYILPHTAQKWKIPDNIENTGQIIILGKSNEGDFKEKV
ncbi:Chaperone protein ecpD [Granulibacter bethesdensis CGDNIH1]|uniref:Chaperone protein ecpD n=2 Tax=Granulibacter bethesdensis TaxID=364410 RepID=Q0BSH6_GRABC|nr:Chaperone protein ecpD [Granulibacter bethesdensis CGDNIH1]APH52053.1 Chaperone protein ecpD [Granulibacter bethesdensis]APH64743.1 Chaperone protein ecpD [Granulibacter bethesdensis]